jgi:hypothetical protein
LEISEDWRNSGHNGRRVASSPIERSKNQHPARERRAALSMLYGYTAPGFHHTGPQASLCFVWIETEQLGEGTVRVHEVGAYILREQARSAFVHPIHL